MLDLCPAPRRAFLCFIPLVVYDFSFVLAVVLGCLAIVAVAFVV